MAELLGGMSAAEFGLWQEFYQSNGFDVDRIEVTTANVGAAWAGGPPSKYVAEFGDGRRRVDHLPREAQADSLLAALDGIGAKGA